MSRDFLIENVRRKLTENGIKLWTSPYFLDGSPVESEIDTLGDSFSEILGIDKETCIAALNELQQHSLDKLRAKEIFETTGIASLKIRCPGTLGGTKLVSVNIKLTEIGEDLQKMVAEKLQTSSARVKLISSGKVVDLFKTLDAQNIRNNQQLMAVLLSESEQEAEQEDKMYDKLRKIREDALTLINSNRDSGFMHMEDQSGNAISLPTEERRAIMLALALHEKARTFLKKEQFSEALILLLDADKEWNNCASDLLKTVDNYALLNLDIVWCYLVLKSVMQLPDADRRLKICEDNFRQCYGDNFDRVQVLKGSAENEKALIMRLHLMQAVLYFHQNRKNEASHMLQQAEIELNGLRVNDSCLEALIEMGYSSSEARISLRANNNNIDNAITHILQRRQQKKDARNAYKEQQEFKKFMGKDEKDVHIKTDLLQTLVEMGFRKELAVLALSKTNNAISEAVTMLQEKSDDLTHELSENVKADSCMVETLVSFGFTPEMAKMALKMTINNQNDALDYLLKLQSDGTYDSLTDNNLPSTSSGAAIVGQAKNLKKKMDEMKVYKRFTEDISSDEDSYLDLPLQMEEKLISDYKKFLNM